MNLISFKDQSGVVAVLFAIMMPIIIGFAALGIELGFLLYQEQKLQRIADAVSYSGALELASTDDPDQAELGAYIIAARNNLNSNDDVDVSIDSDRVSVTITDTISRQLSQIYSKQPFIVRVKSVSAVLKQGDDSVCMIADSIKFKGTSRITLNGCTIRSNLNDIDVSGNSLVSAECVSSPSRLDDTVLNNLNLNCESPKVVDLIPDDPYEDTVFPGVNDYKLYASNVVGISNNKWELSCKKSKDKSDCDRPSKLLSGYYENIPIGYFPEGLELSQNVDLQPGIYIISGKGLTVKPNSNIFGNDVTFYFVDGAELDIQGQSYLEISAPESGSLENILFGSVDAGKTVLNTFTAKMQGSVYLPNKDVKFTGQIKFDGDCVQFISKSIEFAGNAQVQSDCTSTSLEEVFTQTVRLIE